MVKQLLTKMLLVAACLLTGTSVWAQTTTTLMEYGTNDEAWTAGGLATWTAGGSPHFDNDVTPTYVEISGGNGSYATSKTISPSANVIINLIAVWRGRSNTGRNFSDGNGSYFRFGNIVVAQNDQTQKHGYGFTGIDNMASVTQFSAGSYRVEISSSTWLKIEATINTATNTMTSFTIKSEDGVTTYVTQSNVVLSSPDYTTVAFGYRKSGGVSTTNTEQLKSIKITQTTQAVSVADYTINYKLGENLVKTVSSSSTVGATITADVAIDGTEEGYVGKHYLITAADAPSMTLVAEAASNVLNVSVRAPYTATLNVTKNIGGVAESPVVTNLTETDAKVCSWAYTYPMYVQKDGVYYIADETSSFGESGNFTDGQSINKTVNYTNPDYSVVYFGEPNESSGTNTAYSNGNTGYITGGVGYASNSVIRLGTLPAGTYRLITNVTGSASRNVVVGDCTDTSAFPTALVTITTTGAKDETFSVDGSTPISISGKDQGSSKFNQSADVDYILVKASTVPATITDAGWSTFASTYALDLSGITASTGTVKAYYASEATGSTVTLAETTATVPAGEGIMLKGTAGATITIPVAASGTAISSNLLKGQTTTGNVAASTAGTYHYVFGFKTSDPSEYGFYKLTAATEVAAGKAYLETTGELAGARIAIVFDDNDATAISEAKSQLPTANSQFFDLQGRRVAQPTKGLYIVNGKKVIIK